MSDFVLQEPQQEQPQEDKKHLNFISREHMLFATPFWQTKVEGVDNEPIKKYCYEMRDKTEGVVISNRGGWHSKEILQPIPDELKNFFNQVQGWANNYCAKITNITDLVLGNWWVNINPKYTYNRHMIIKSQYFQVFIMWIVRVKTSENLWWREMIIWSSSEVGIKALHRFV